MRYGKGGSTRRSGSSLAATAALAVACSLLLSGCFFRSIVGFVDERGGVSLSGNVQAGFCDFGTGIEEFWGCTYTTRDGDGRVIEIISTFELVTEFGLLGLLIDPLVLQVPADASNVDAIYNNAGSDEPLVVTETTSFAVTPTVTVQAEPGTKFLILELPDAVVEAIPPGGADFDFSVDFDVGNPVGLEIKPMLTARVVESDATYYLPLLPCVTDFAQVPAIAVPIAGFFQDLRATIAALMESPDAPVCDREVYQFVTAPATTAPTTSTTTTTTTTPTTTTSTTSTTTAPTTTTITSTTVAAAAVTSTTAPPGVLPVTGSNADQAAIALLLVALGTGLVALATRRRRTA